jgi:hypothetical protein
MPVNLNIVSARLPRRRASAASSPRAAGERRAEDHAEDDDLQDFAIRHRLGEVLREDVEDHVLPGARRRGRELAGVDRRGQRNAHPGTADRDGRPADEERERGHDLEVDERFHAHPSHLPQVGVAGDAHDERGKEQRRDDRADQPEEDLADEAQRHRQVGKVMAQHAPGHDGDEDPERQRPVDAHGRLDGLKARCEAHGFTLVDRLSSRLRPPGGRAIKYCASEAEPVPQPEAQPR